jgi:hypothetical protein
MGGRSPPLHEQSNEIDGIGFFVNSIGTNRPNGITMKFNQSSQHSPPRDLNQSLSMLQQISRSMTGELHILDRESALLEALQHKPVTSIGWYQVNTNFSRDDSRCVPAGQETDPPDYTELNNALRPSVQTDNLAPLPLSH